MKLLEGGNSTRYIFVEDEETGVSYTVKLREWDDGRRCCSIRPSTAEVGGYISCKEIKMALEKYRCLKEILLFAIQPKTDNPH